MTVPHRQTTLDIRIACHECGGEPFDSDTLFFHLRTEHGIGMEVVTVEVPVPLRSIEQDIEGVEAKIAALPWRLRWYYRLKVRGLRRQMEEQRDRELASFFAEREP